MSIYTHLSLQDVPSCLLTLSEESLAISYYPLTLHKGSELPRKDGRRDVSKAVQLWGAWGAWHRPKIPATLCRFILSCAGPLPGIQSFILPPDLWESFSIWAFLKMVCSEGFKWQTSGTSRSAWQGGFSRWAFQSPSLVEAPGTTSAVGQTPVHQKPCASLHALHCGPASALHCLPSLQLSKSKSSALAETAKWLHFAWNK